MWVGLIQSVKDLNRTKCPAPLTRRNSPAYTHRTSSALWLFLVCGLLILTTDLDLTVFNHVSQLFKTNLLYMYTPFVLFLWRTLT